MTSKMKTTHQQQMPPLTLSPNGKAYFTPKAPIQAIFWDVDGTLVLTEELHLLSIIQACADYGATIPATEFKNMQGIGQDQCFAYLSRHYGFPHVDLSEWKHNVERYYHGMVDQMELTFASLSTLLKDIAVSPIRQAAVSNGQKNDVKLSIDMIGADLFEFYLSIDDTIDGKPAPTPYLMAAEKMGIAPENCLVVEDSMPGVQSGIAAGMNVITRPYAFYEENKHIYDQADLVVDDFEKVDWHKILGL